MALVLVAALAFIAHRTRAGVVDLSGRAYGTCQQLTIPVTVSANSAVYNIPRVNNDIDAIAYALNADTWSSPKGPQSAIQNTTTDGTFNIHAQLCVPSTFNASSENSNILQIATHGLHYDGRYWDPEIHRSTNSYVDAALKAGYSILTYDRLGVGQSDKPDAYTVVQAPIQLEVLHQLTLKARNGTLCSSAATAKRSSPRNYNSVCSSLTPPDKIIHIGHSFGSVLTTAYISTYGSFSDGAIITGYIPNKMLGTVGASTFVLRNAATDPSNLFTDRSSGYLVSTKQGIQNVFFGGNPATAFTQELLDYGDATKQPLTVGEYTSAYTIVLAGQGSLEFTGPLQYFLAENDFYICRGDCKDVYDEEALKQLFPNVKGELDIYVHPNTGHALPLHNNATAGYEVMFDFLERNGLGGI